MESAKWLKDKVTSLIEAGVYEDAIPYLEKLISLPGAKPYDVYFAHFTLGEIHYEAGRWARAQKHFLDALMLGGDDPLVLMLLGQVYCAQGKYNKGRKVLERAWKLKPHDTGIELSLGTCMCMQMEFEDAEEIFRRAIKKDETSYEVYLGLAQALIGQNRWDEARAVLEEARKQFPLVLPIRQALKDVEKIDQIEEFYNWMTTSDVLGDEDDLEPGAERKDIPVNLAHYALVQLELPAEAMEGARRIWDDYLRLGHSVPRYPESWAAGIVYTLVRLYERSDILQADVARKFYVSQASVSRTFRKLSKALKIRERDPRYTGGS